MISRLGKGALSFGSKGQVIPYEGGGSSYRQCVRLPLLYELLDDK